MTRRVVVTGMGTINPLGKNVEQFWRAIRAGENGIGVLDRFDTTDFTAKIAGQVGDFAPEAILGTTVTLKVKNDAPLSGGVSATFEGTLFGE